MRELLKHLLPGARPPSPPATDAETVGQWLYDGLMAYCGADSDPWAVERTTEIGARLNAVRAPAPPLEIVPLFLGEIEAFTAPGSWVYVTRGLLHRAWWEEAAALVIAHEMAHHDLGHTRLFAERLTWAQRVPGSLPIRLLVTGGIRRLYGPEGESAADARALELCLEAGYEGERCLGLFDLLETHALDLGDIDMALGPGDGWRFPGCDTASRAEARAQWAWEHLRGYPCVRDRKAALERQLYRKRR